MQYRQTFLQFKISPTLSLVLKYVYIYVNQLEYISTYGAKGSWKIAFACFSL